MAANPHGHPEQGCPGQGRGTAVAALRRDFAVLGTLGTAGAAACAWLCLLARTVAEAIAEHDNVAGMVLSVHPTSSLGGTDAEASLIDGVAVAINRRVIAVGVHP
jgi:hypothetical protein